MLQNGVDEGPAVGLVEVVGVGTGGREWDGGGVRPGNGEVDAGADVPAGDGEAVVSV